MIWKNVPDLQIINQWNENTLASHLGIVIEEITDDAIIATMPVDQRTKQPMGLLHGGASAAFAESLGSIASFLSLENPENHQVAGIDIHATHINPVTAGRVKGIVRPLKTGKNIHFWCIDIYDENQKPVCHSTLSVMVKKKI